MKSCNDVVLPKRARGMLSPLIFLHGITESKGSWTRVAPIIVEKTGRKAFLLDARNHGRSPRSSEMNYDVLLTDLLEFMDDLRIRKAVIIGHSMGGRTAINIALKHPERVEAVVIEEMTARNVRSGDNHIVPLMVQAGGEMLLRLPPEMPVDDAKMEIFKYLINFPTNGMFMDRVRGMKYYHPSYIPLFKLGGTIVAEADLNALTAMFQSNALVQNLPSQNLSFSGDALFLYGSKGFFNLGKDITIPKLFPKAVVKKVEGASHMMHHSFPEEYSQIVSEFILQIDSSKSKL